MFLQISEQWSLQYSNRSCCVAFASLSRSLFRLYIQCRGGPRNDIDRPVQKIKYDTESLSHTSYKWRGAHCRGSKYERTYQEGGEGGLL